MGKDLRENLVWIAAPIFTVAVVLVLIGWFTGALDPAPLCSYTIL